MERDPVQQRYRSDDDKAADAQQPGMTSQVEELEQLQRQRQRQQMVGRRINMRILPVVYAVYTLVLGDIDLSIGCAVYRGGRFGEDSIYFYSYIAIFFASYCILEMPARVLVQRFSPHVWLSSAVGLFGFTTMVQGAVQSYGILLATRFLLGAFGIAMIAGTFYLTGLWYPRWEAVYRHDMFTTFLPLVLLLHALLLYGIQRKTSGLETHAAWPWRWPFLFQGGFAVLLGLLVFFLLPSRPETTEWLSKDDKEFVASRRSHDPSRCIRAPDMTPDDIGKVFKSSKVVLGAAVYLCFVVPACLYANLSPAADKESRYHKILAQIHDSPPWLAPMVFGMLLGPFGGANSWH